MGIYPSIPMGIYFYTQGYDRGIKNDTHGYRGYIPPKKIYFLKIIKFKKTKKFYDTQKMFYLRLFLRYFRYRPTNMGKYHILGGMPQNSILKKTLITDVCKLFRDVRKYQ